MVSTGTTTWEDAWQERERQAGDKHIHNSPKFILWLQTPQCFHYVSDQEREYFGKTVTNCLHQKIKKSRPASDPGYSNGNKSPSKPSTLAGLSLDFYNVSEHGLWLLKFHRFLHLLINIYCKESSCAVREVVSTSSSRNPTEMASRLVSRINSGEWPKAIAVDRLFHELSKGNGWLECGFQSPPKINK